jgi:hypothetical protein
MTVMQSLPPGVEDARQSRFRARPGDRRQASHAVLAFLQTSRHSDVLRPAAIVQLAIAV